MEIAATGLAAISAPLPALSGPIAAPDTLATARFSALMQGGPTSTGAPGLLAPAREASFASGAGPASMAMTSPVPLPTSMGDRVLTGMQSISNDFQSAYKRVSAALDADQLMSTQDLLKLQLNLSQISIQYDLVGKAISRSTQNFDQLVRVQ